MDQPATKLVRTASGTVIFPIAGLLGGLFVGALRASTKGPDELAKLLCAIKWSTAGFFLGLFVIVLLSLNLGGKNIVSVRRLMAVIAIAGLLSWYITRILFGVIGFEGF